MDLLLFDAPADDAPSAVLPLDRATNRTGGYWHGFVPGIGAGQVYAFRARGPWAPAAGVRFDERLVLLDPYGRGVAVPPGYARDLSPAAPDAIGRAMKSVVVDLSAYDWEGDRPLNRPLHDTVVYEAHVRGFTAHPNSGVADGRRGTYAGFIERIPYLVDLGVSAIELLPVFQFDRLAAPAGRPNYWGYQPVSYFAPHAPYSSRPDRARRCRRVPRSRQGAPPRRARGHPRRRLQPHGRERPRRADLLLPRARQRGVLPARRARRLRRLQRDRQQPRRQRRGGAPAHRRQPALLGRGDARRRLPLRSRVRAVTRRGRPAAGAAADPVGHRQRPGAVRDEADRRGVGRRRAVPGRLVRGRPLGGVERPLPG